MRQNDQPLMVGAGPVGTAAALWLKKQNIHARIIDKNAEPSRHSKALAVNPRTLELLESTGVTARMLAIGRRISGMRFHHSDRRFTELPFGLLRHKYPFMLALSQATTERLLRKELEAAGTKVEYGTALVSCVALNDRVEVGLRHLSDGSTEIVNCPWLLAADGAHSTVRGSLGLDFKGSSFKGPWHLADMRLDTSLDEDCGHVFVAGGGFTFLIRVVDETTEHMQGAKLWRVISDSKDGLRTVPETSPVGTPVWTSEFRISHRVSERFQVRNVFLAGDAAHIHSPIGARGMNLGIEDAWVFSRLFEAKRIQDYESLRLPCDRKVVHRINRFSRVVLAESLPATIGRAAFIRCLPKLPLLRTMFLKMATGLDHSLEVKGTTPGPSSGDRRGARQPFTT